MVELKELVLIITRDRKLHPLAFFALFQKVVIENPKIGSKFPPKYLDIKSMINSIAYPIKRLSTKN